MRLNILILFVLICLTACIRQEPMNNPNVLGVSAEYEIRVLTTYEKVDVINQIKAAEGVKYVWGGQTLASGIDCSGLLVWSYAMLGYSGFFKDDYIVYDLTSQDIMTYNADSVVIIRDTNELLNYVMGDFLFFDVNGDGQIDHVAVFMYYDETNDAVWVWDASTNKGKVAYRQVYNFLKKNPSIGKPVMPVKRAKTGEFRLFN